MLLYGILRDPIAGMTVLTPISFSVNSVPRFENAWMQRSKFPYTARSSAKVIRHAVSIDERRAKFRQDLLSETKTSRPNEARGYHKYHHARKPYPTDTHRSATTNGLEANPHQIDRFRRRSRARLTGTSSGIERAVSPQYKANGQRGRLGTVDLDASSVNSAASSYLPEQLQDPEEEEDEDEGAKQDVEEVWFPGCHADLGGGWPLADGEESPLSHGPLVWMVREAQRAGLEFEYGNMLALKCCDDTFSSEIANTAPNGPTMPGIQISTPGEGNLFSSPKSEKADPGWAPGMEPSEPRKSVFEQNLETAATRGVLHDCLEFNNGLTHASVISWKIMEYMPFRRMDLRPDGSWKAISFPLPMGETRDIPENAWIHHSAIRRMEADPNYRPGNLIIGGGGRGIRRAPKERGIGEWEVLKGNNDPVGMVYVRKGESLDHKIDRGAEAVEKASGR